MQLNRAREGFAAAGAQLIAVSVDPPETAARLRERLGLDIELYSDPGGAVARAWNVYDADTEIALAASFVIRRGGAVVFRYIGADKSDRPPARELLDVVRRVP